MNLIGIDNMKDLERELLKEVQDWQSKTFNHIQLNVYEKICDNTLFEYIEQLEPNYEEILNNYSLWSEYEEWLKDNDIEDNDEEAKEENKKTFIEENHPYKLEDSQSENYPMWNTLFEIKEGNWETLTEAAKKVGCGIISGMDDFNDTIFMMSCGHSFYSSYWIPMYLEIFKSEAKKYKGVNYSHL